MACTSSSVGMKRQTTGDGASFSDEAMTMTKNDDDYVFDALKMRMVLPLRCHIRIGKHRCTSWCSSRIFSP